MNMNKTMNAQNLKKVLALHHEWVERVPGGKQADLRQMKFVQANLVGVDFREAICSDAVFRCADLRGAKFCNANLKFAVFAGANLEGTDFSGADLTFANFTGANLQDARFTGATLLKACFKDITLSWYDYTLISEILWQAAGEDFDKQMVAAFIGRKKAWCWDDYNQIPSQYRLWIIKYFRNLVKPDDNAPPFFKVREQRLKAQQQRRVG